MRLTTCFKSAAALAGLAAAAFAQSEPQDAQSLNSTVTAVAFLETSPALLSATNDGRVRLHDVPSGDVTASVELHTGAIRALAVSPDGAHAATAGVDGRIRILDLKGRQPVADVAHDVVALGYSTDGRTLRAVNDAGALLALDPTTGVLRQTFPCPDPRETSGAFIFGDLIVQAYEDG